MNKIKGLITISAFSLMVLCLPAIASAQYGNGGWNNGGNNNGGNNNGGYNNGQYGNGNYGDVRSIVRDLKSHSRELQRHLDRDLDDSRYNGSRREDQLNDLAKQFRKSVNRLSESNNGPRQNDVQRVLDLGRQMEHYFSRSGLDYHIQEIWNDIRNDLRELNNSSRYNDNGNNRNYPNNYPSNYPNNNRRSLPSWWPF